MTSRNLISDAAERRQAVLDRIHSNCRIDPDKGCWIWQGATSGDGRGGGYGRIKIDGRTCAVHRVVASHFWGFLHPGRQVDHTCTNRLCCNPEHLEPVTHLENQRRRAAAPGCAK